MGNFSYSYNGTIEGQHKNILIIPREKTKEQIIVNVR